MQIKYPMVALAALNFTVLLLIPIRRFRAGIAGQLGVAHSAIHLTCNRVRHRLLAFGASNVALVMPWTKLLRALSN